MFTRFSPRPLSWVLAGVLIATLAAMRLMRREGRPS